MLNVQVPRDRKKLEKQIKALECLLSQDTKNIHRQALESCKRSLNTFEGI